MQIRAKLSELHEGVNTLRRVRKQIDAWCERLNDEAVTNAGAELKDKFRAGEDDLIQWRAKAGQDTLNFPVKLNAKLAALIASVSGAEGRPTQQAHDVFAALSAKADAPLATLAQVLDAEVPGFNAVVGTKAGEAVV